MTDLGGGCPACGGEVSTFHREDSVPVNSCLLLDDATEARLFPRGKIELAICERCAFITNRVFDADLAEYSSRYEETQAYSAHFRGFARDLARRWVEQYGLRGREVLEIGCGKGEFLTYLVEEGVGHGTGIDPGVKPERIETPVADRLTWIADFYSADYAHLQADAIVCRHTLEHLPDVGAFMTTLRAAIGDRTDTMVLFELPDVLRVLRDVAFEDVYYEHCSYFSAGSLARLFRRTGFEVLDLWRDYGDQYLMIESRPSAVPAAGEPLAIEDDREVIHAEAQHFVRSYREQLAQWRTRIDAVHDAGGRVAIWGGGSKCVAFLNGLDQPESVACVVDINPHKQGKFIAGTDQQVVAPAALGDVKPELVVAMNEVYRDEIQAELDRLGVDTTLLTL